MDGIFAMVVAYLLIAMLFTELYYLTLVWDPQAMHLLKPFEEMKPSELRGELLYFSMVTISTVGYGDVLPVSPTARMLAVIEAVTGPVLRRRAGRNVRRHVRVAAVRQPRSVGEGAAGRRTLSPLAMRSASKRPFRVRFDSRRGHARRIEPERAA